MNLFELFALLKLDKSNYEKGLSESETQANSFGSKVSSIMATATKAITAGVVAGATAVGALVTSGVEAYSSYEQLVGGVDTLFKDASSKVQEYAANAYQTAGMSANDYMETVTSFSASLLQSLDGDTTAAADKANEAITDMSDNANKMGTSMESIQNAYQGFAKQNYTMLDNLKLGYGGTKEEMERLLEDAGKISGITYDISSYADVVDAIHVMQESMGIAGTTAKEASTTIEGSFNSMKSAWENLVAGLGNKDADLSALIGNLVESTKTYAGNLIPVVEQALTGVGTLVEELVPQITNEIPALLNDVLPQLLDSGKNMLSSIIEGITGNASGIVSGVMQVIEEMIGAIAELAPELLEMGVELLQSILEGIVEALPEIATTIATMIENMAQYIQDNLPMIIEQGLILIQEFADSLAENLPIILQAGIDLLMALTEGIVQALPTMIEMLPQIIDTFANIINDNAPTILQCGIQIILALIQGIIESIPVIIENIPMIIQTIVDVFTAFQWLDLGKNIMNLLKEGILGMKGLLKDAGKNIFDAIEGAIKSLPETLKNLGTNGIKGLINGIKGMIASLITAAKGLVTNMLSTFKSLSLKDVGINIIKGLIEGITSMGSKLFSSITGLLSTAVSTAKKALGIHSPSKVFAGIGDYMVQGLEQGWDNNIDEVKRNIESDMNFTAGEITTSTNYTVGVSGMDGVSEMLAQYLPQLANMSIVMDTGATVGQLAPTMDAALGKRLAYANRGV